MKKVIGAIIAVFAVLSFGLSASADGAISTSEQTILNELNAGVKIGGKQFYFTSAEINSVENHLKRVDLTQSQVDEAVKNIQAARSLAEGVTVDTSNANTLLDALRLLPSDVIAKLQQYVIAAGNAVGVKITFGANGTYSAVTVTDAKGSTVYKTGSTVKNTGTSYIISGITFCSVILAAVGAMFLSRNNKSSLNNETI